MRLEVQDLRYEVQDSKFNIGYAFIAIESRISGMGAPPSWGALTPDAATFQIIGGYFSRQVVFRYG